MNEISSLYIHFPFCIQKCNYCDFFSNSITDQAIANYEQQLIDSFRRVKDLLKSERFEISPLKTIYLGGGTPSLWEERGAQFLSSFFEKNNLTFDKNIEFTIEINPKTNFLETVDSFKSLGVNRFSIGIQSTNDFFLKTLERVHTKDEIFPLLNKLHNQKENYSVDFIIGLPFSESKKRDIISEIEEVLKYNPSHISVYILDVSTNYKHFKSLPSEKYVENEYLKVSNYLQKNGFNHYEVSNFSKDNMYSRHNMSYWNSDPILALGPSATGFLPKKQSALRYKFKKSKTEFDMEELSHKQLKLEELYLSFRTSNGIILDSFFSPSQIDKLRPYIDKWITNKFVKEDQNQVVATPKGFLVLDSLMDDIFKID